MAWPTTPAQAVANQITSRPYIGFVATNGTVADSTLSGASALTAWARCVSYARASITDLRLVWGNFYANGGEIAGAGSFAITASVEYPVGVFTQVKFGGSASGACAAGALITSDVVPIAIPNGARFWVRQYFTSAAFSIHYNNIAGIVDLTQGEGFNYSIGTLADPTMGGAMADASGGAIMIRPLAYLGTTTKASWLLLGDSRNAGSSDTLSNGMGLRGELARLIGQDCGYSNCSRAGEAASGFNSAGTRRRLLLPYATHVLCGDGINDIIGGANAAATQASLTTMHNSVAGSGRVLVQTTLSPGAVTTTDAYATVANQTAGARNSIRVAVNAWIRAIPAPLSNIFDCASIVESARDSGLWKAPGFTADGTHGTRLANETISNSIIPVS